MEQLNSQGQTRAYAACIPANVQVLPKEGYFIISSLELKINRITKADKHFIDAAKQVKPEPMVIEKC